MTLRPRTRTGAAVPTPDDAPGGQPAQTMVPAPSAPNDTVSTDIGSPLHANADLQGEEHPHESIPQQEDVDADAHSETDSSLTPSRSRESEGAAQDPEGFVRPRRSARMPRDAYLSLPRLLDEELVSPFRRDQGLVEPDDPENENDDCLTPVARAIERMSNEQRMLLVRRLRNLRIVPEELSDSSETERTYCKSKAERKAERAQKREERRRQCEATNDELESMRETDGDHEPRYHHEEEIETHQDKGKGIDPDKLGTLEGIDPWELTPEAQLAEYECLKSVYMHLRNRMNQSTYQEKAESARKHHKNSCKHNKEPNKDSSPDSSSDDSDQSCHHSKKRKSSQRKAE